MPPRMPVFQRKGEAPMGEEMPPEMPMPEGEAEDVAAMEVQCPECGTVFDPANSGTPEVPPEAAGEPGAGIPAELASMLGGSQ